MNLDTYRDKKVLVTGHTGFKGSWLCEWLMQLGAEVYGYALKPPTTPSLFACNRLAKRIACHTIGDIRNRAKLEAYVAKVRPDFIFHLAAQPIVRESYRIPAETFDVNVMGTVNVLEAARLAGCRCDVVCITTDKCYENDNSGRAFRETDPMGGSDPYSASKGACEVAIAAYRRSFFSAADSSVRLASARAGNVIGGGDWAADRIVPDAIRAFLADKPLVVRNRHSTRPWQHVLEPLCGYLMLGAALQNGNVAAQGAFNFGPSASAVKTVGDLVAELQRNCTGLKVKDFSDPTAPGEAKLLRLDSSKAAKVLGWKPRWNFRKTITATADWYLLADAGEDTTKVCQRQIGEYYGC